MFPISVPIANYHPYVTTDVSRICIHMSEGRICPLNSMKAHIPQVQRSCEFHYQQELALRPIFKLKDSPSICVHTDICMCKHAAFSLLTDIAN